MTTTHSSSPVAKRHAQAGQWRTPAATFPHPLTFELDGDFRHNNRDEGEALDQNAEEEVPQVLPRHAEV